MEFAAAVAARGCSGAAAPGALALEGAACEHWAQRGLYSLGIYNCRRIGGSQAWSVHAEGRAVDLGVPADPPGLILGAEVVRTLLAGGDRTLQRIIWDRRTWCLESPNGAPYGGTNPHTDHVHVELSWAAARGDIPLELALDTEEEEETMPYLIVAFRGAQFVVDPALTSKRGLADSADVRALLDVDGGRAYCPATLSDALMAKIPNAV